MRAGSYRIVVHIPARDVLFIGDAFVTMNMRTGATGPRGGLVLPGHGQPGTGSLGPAPRLILSGPM
ncbi:MAG: hypothetical protein AUH85_16010 [Chloroflexi bacterium 13_1_40CM_4_68_4]|nr:MAG: hypothetical protein AUH85_16010 [Chloroflexi bacterium 13_1_40CM_4_68_4]